MLTNEQNPKKVADNGLLDIVLFVAEAGNCNAGIGYNGLDEQGQPKWDLMSNAKVRNVEVS